VTTKENTFEGGSDTVTITTGNSGGASGTAFDAFTGTAPTFSVAGAFQGAMGMSAQAASGTASTANWTGFGSTSVTARFFYLYTTRTIATQLVQARTAAGQSFGVTQSSSGNILNFVDSAGTGIAGGNSNAMVNGRVYVIDVQVFSDATVGTLSYQMYDWLTETLHTSFSSAANLNTRGGNITEFRIGKHTASTDTVGFMFDSVKVVDGTLTPVGHTLTSMPPATRVAVTTGAPANTNAFTPTLPTHAAGDRILVFVAGKYDTTTIPTVNSGWLTVGSGTGGTGVTGADTGLVFWALYAIDATSSSQTAPTVTPGATAPNSWEWVAVSYRPGAGKGWRDPIVTSAPWVASGSDTNTASALTAAATLTNKPTTGDAVAAFGVTPTDLGTALGATTLATPGLAAGTLTADTYIENALGADTASVHATWDYFIGTSSSTTTPSFTITSSTNHSGVVVVVALRETDLLARMSGAAVMQAVNRGVL